MQTQSASAPVSKTKHDISSRSYENNSSYQHLIGETYSKSIRQQKSQCENKISSKRLTFRDKIKRNVKASAVGLWIGTFAVYATFYWIQAQFKTEFVHNEEYFTPQSHHLTSSSLLPKGVRCGNINKLGVFAPPAWFDFLLSSGCPSGPHLSLFRIDNDGFRNPYGNKKHEWKSTNKNFALEFMFAKSERIHSILLMMPFNQREMYIQAGAQFRLFGQSENSRGVTKLIDTVMEEGFYERTSKFESISFSCMLASKNSYSKFRIEIECKKTVNHHILKIVIL